MVKMWKMKKATGNQQTMLLLRIPNFSFSFSIDRRAPFKQGGSEEKFGQFAPCFLTTTGISFCHIYFSVAKKQRALKHLSYLEKRKGGREKEKGRRRRNRKKNRKERERVGERKHKSGNRRKEIKNT